MDTTETMNQDNICNESSESEKFINVIKEAFSKYVHSGPRSNEKTNVLHKGILNIISKHLNSNDYDIKIEKTISSCNSSGNKSCDIIVFRRGIPYIIFPVKFIMTNYYQNKNNGWENLTGEVLHLKKEADNRHIIPINIIFNKIPYCKSSKCINKWENISYKKSYEITEKLVEWGLATNVINYIFDVEQLCNIGEEYNKCPNIIGFNSETPYRSFGDILEPII